MFKQLFAILLTINGFGDIPQRRLPVLKLDTREVVDLGAFSAAVSTLARAGVDTIPLAWLHKKSGIPMPEDGEACLTPRPVPGFTGLTQRISAHPIPGFAALAQLPLPEPPPVDPPQQALDMAPGMTICAVPSLLPWTNSSPRWCRHCPPVRIRNGRWTDWQRFTRSSMMHS